MHEERQNLNDTVIHRPSSFLDESDVQDKPPLPLPKKRPKEVSMFIPKKKPVLKVCLNFAFASDLD